MVMPASSFCLPSSFCLLPSSVVLDHAPWHFLNFLPLPHQHGSLRPILGSSRRTCLTGASSPPVRAGTGARPARGAVVLDPPLNVICVGRRATAGVGGRAGPGAAAAGGPAVSG